MEPFFITIPHSDAADFADWLDENIKGSVLIGGAGEINGLIPINLISAAIRNNITDNGDRIWQFKKFTDLAEGALMKMWWA
jgi:hypothetical protein